LSATAPLAKRSPHSSNMHNAATDHPWGDPYATALRLLCFIRDSTGVDRSGHSYKRSKNLPRLKQAGAWGGLCLPKVVDILSAFPLAQGSFAWIF
jgi:hypothetical protein